MQSNEIENFENLARPFRGQKTFTVRLFGLQRKLELRELYNDRGHWIASNHPLIFGDLEFVSRAAREISARTRKFHPEIVLTAEAKSIFLAGKTAEYLGLTHFEVARKSLKSYNKSPISTEIKSTISRKERLFLDISSQKSLRGKDVMIIDDVVTTGGNILGLERLAKKCGAIVVAKACIWIEGYPASSPAFEARKGLIYLSTLPEFFLPQRLRKIRESMLP